MALFKAYFGPPRWRPPKSCVTLPSASMDRAVAAAWIADAALTESVRAEMAHWMDQNITGVPAIIFDQKFMVPGAQSSETFADVINKVLAKREAA
jgi:predicted DsbA family dithiol-disulfide isomerase